MPESPEKYLNNTVIPTPLVIPFFPLVFPRYPSLLVCNTGTQSHASASLKYVDPHVCEDDKDYAKMTEKVAQGVHFSKARGATRENKTELCNTPQLTHVLKQSSPIAYVSLPCATSKAHNQAQLDSAKDPPRSAQHRPQKPIHD